jgi:Domain of unknown function (DUF4389)
MTTIDDTTPRSEPSPRKSVLLRGLYMAITAFLIGAAQSVLFVLAVIQFLLMLISRGVPNAQIADFGDIIGKWLVSAVKFQTAASEEKPWPMGPLT